MLTSIQNEICEKQNILEDCLVKLEASELNADNLRFIEQHRETLGVKLYRQFIKYLIEEYCLIDEHSDGSEKFLSMDQLVDVMQSDKPLRFSKEYSEYAFGRDHLTESDLNKDYSFKIKLKK